MIPNSPRPRVEETEDGTYRVYVRASPEKGRANSELKAVISNHLDVAKSDIVIMKGYGSRKKILKIESRD